MSQQSTTTAPLISVNSRYVQGIGPGYYPTAGSGLTLNIAAGTAFCDGSVVTYAGGTLSLTASSTNRVYLNSSCTPAFRTTAFTESDIPIATVVTNGSAITSITDQRTWFVEPTPTQDPTSALSIFRSKRISLAIPSVGAFTGFANYFDTGVNGCNLVAFQAPDSNSNFYRANYESGAVADVACGRNTITGFGPFHQNGDKIIALSWMANVNVATNFRTYFKAHTVACCGDWGTDTPTSTTEWFGIRVSTTSSPTGAYCTASNGSSSTFTSMGSGLAIDTSLHEFRVVYDPSVPSVTCTIDGGSETVVTSNVPTDASGFTFSHTIAPTTNSARNMMIMQVYVEEEWQ